jgi:hypothetical protein
LEVVEEEEEGCEGGTCSLVRSPAALAIIFLLLTRKSVGTDSICLREEGFISHTVLIKGF